MRSYQPTGFALVWGALGPLSVLFGGTIVMYSSTSSQAPSYRVFDSQDARYRQARKRTVVDRRPRHRRRTSFN